MRLVKQLTIALFALFAVSNFAFAGKLEPLVPPTIPGTTLVNAEQIFDLLDKFPNLVMIDSRKPSDHEKGYIEGSIGLPDTETTAASLAKVIKTKSTPVVFYCNGVRCHRSVHAARKAVKLGYTKVFWFRGGWGEWLKKGYPVAK